MSEANRKGFAVRLRVAMAVNNFSGNDVAKALGVTPQAVNKWALGKMYPSSSVLLALCEHLGCSLDWIMDPFPIDLRSPSPETLRLRSEPLPQEASHEA